MVTIKALSQSIHARFRARGRLKLARNVIIKNEVWIKDWLQLVGRFTEIKPKSGQNGGNNLKNAKTNQ